MTVFRDLLADHLLRFAALAVIAVAGSCVWLLLVNRRHPKPPAAEPFDCFKPLPRRRIAEPSRAELNLVVAEAIRACRDSVHH